MKITVNGTTYEMGVRRYGFSYVEAYVVIPRKFWFAKTRGLVEFHEVVTYNQMKGFHKKEYKRFLEDTLKKYLAYRESWEYI